MKVRDILKVKGSQLYTIGPDQTVLDAVAILMQHRIGALLVRDATGTVSGIISQRDVLRECLHRSADLGRIPVREVMTRDLVVCVPDDDVDYAMELRTKKPGPPTHRSWTRTGWRLRSPIGANPVKAGLEEAEYENRYLKDTSKARKASRVLGPAQKGPAARRRPAAKRGPDARRRHRPHAKV